MTITDAGQIQSFESLMKEYSQLTVALFQRNYSWEITNISDLYGDIKERKSIFIGCFIFHNTGVRADSLKTAEVVDGQQRITTLFILLAGLRDAIASLPKEYQEIPKTPESFAKTPARTITDLLFDGAPNLPRFEANPLISKIFSKNIIADPDKRPKVPIRSADGTATLALRSAFHKVKELIENDLAQIPEPEAKIRWIEELRSSIFSLRCLRISSDSPHDALDVFLSLNSKGKPLSRADIIRGILLQRRCEILESPAEIQEVHARMHEEWTEMVGAFQAADLDDGYIEQFFRYYLLATSREKVQKKAAPSVVEDRIRFENPTDIENRRERLPVEMAHRARDIWEEIVAYSTNYIAVVKPGDENYRTKYYLTLLKALSDNYRILLMATLHNAVDDEAPIIEEIARLSLVLSLRHYLNGGNAQDLEGVFQAIANDLRAGADFAAVASILETEVAKVKLNTLDRFSKDVLALAKPTLHFIEWNLCEKQGINYLSLPVWNTKEVHLEHIAPESPTQEWKAALSASSLDDQEYATYVEQLGNKTLLDKKINTSIQQADFETKKDHYTTIKKVIYSYEKSAFFSTRELSKLDKWSVAEINLRNQWLARVFDVITSPKLDLADLVWFEDWRPKG